MHLDSVGVRFPVDSVSASNLCRYWSFWQSAITTHRFTHHLV